MNMNISHETIKKTDQTILRFFLAIGLLACLTLATPWQAQAQNKDVQLADEYFQKKEYEKANSLYEKLALRPQYLKQIYANYLASLPKRF